jgi:hypothetical protein
MSTSDWIALGAAVIAALSLGVSGWATCYARSSAKSNKVMAAANEAMAEEAKESRVLAAGQRRADMDQVHHDHAPQIPDEIVASVEHGQPNGSLVGLLTLAGHKTYRVDGEALFNGGGSTPLSLPFLLTPGSHTVHIEHWAPDQEAPKVEAVRLWFWPPVAGDDADVWECPCGKPTAETAALGGHWSRTIPVVFGGRLPRYRAFPPGR